MHNKFSLCVLQPVPEPGVTRSDCAGPFYWTWIQCLLTQLCAGFFARLLIVFFLRDVIAFTSTTYQSKRKIEVTHGRLKVNIAIQKTIIFVKFCFCWIYPKICSRWHKTGIVRLLREKNSNYFFFNNNMRFSAF